MKTISIKHCFLLIPVLIVLIIQIPNLGLPYFYDEAWSYIPSIKKMAEVGPSLLPGVLPIGDCKGHPQMFFFIASIWMNLFHGNIIMMRILPLLFSLGVLGSVYVLMLKLVNWESAMIATLLISVQPVFLAQSIFLLPEMLMIFLFVLSFYFFLNRQFTAYAISNTIMVLTKETAIVFAISFGLYYLFSLFLKSNREKHRHIYLLALATPGIFYAAFLLLHYLKFGVVFYGDHLGYVSLDWPSIHYKIFIGYRSILIDYGKRFISMAAIVGLIAMIIQGPKYTRFLILGIVSFLSYMLFTILNFYTLRYSMAALVIYLIVFACVIGQLRINNLIKAGITFTLAAICLYFSLTQKQSSDIDLGYVETVKIYQQTVHFCENNNLYDQPIATSFNIGLCLHLYDLGYVKGDKSFSHITDVPHYLEARYLIYESTMPTPTPETDYAIKNFKLVKSFVDHHAWAYIYENTQYQATAVNTIP
ncbi:MAG TPA: glycosyltransferase family 39 protein [Prolixibacteraceae bacterium]|jgi:hypothetical protein